MGGSSSSGLPRDAHGRPLDDAGQMAPRNSDSSAKKNGIDATCTENRPNSLAADGNSWGTAKTARRRYRREQHELHVPYSQLIEYMGEEAIARGAIVISQADWLG